MKIASYGLSDRGIIRQKNEDAFLVDDPLGLYAVADGLGGLPEGARASHLAIERLKNEVREPLNGAVFDFDGLFERINRCVFEEGCRISREIGIGTTLTVLFLRDHAFTISHVGDCAAFLIRENMIHQLTTDHTMEQELRASMGFRGGYIPEYFSHTLTRCIGQKDQIETDVIHERLEKGDRILICSDGITKVIEDEELLAVSQKTMGPQIFVETLIDSANKRGGPDNATAVAIFAE